MKRTLQIGGLFLMAVGLWVGVELALAVRTLNRASAELEHTLSTLRTKTVPDVAANLNGTLIQAGLVLDQVRQMAETQQDTAREALQHTARATKATADTLERANSLITRLEQEVVPEATRTLRTTQESIQGIQSLTKELSIAVKESSDRLAPVLDGAAKSTESLNRVLAEDVPPVLERAEGTIKNLEETTQHAEELVEYYKKKLTKPTHWAKVMVLTILELGAKVGNIVTGFAK